MTAELDYSFLNNNFNLRINNELMNRAVRVKETVKDKISTVFNKNVSVDVKQVEETGLKSMIDVSDENLLNLNGKLKAMENQGKVSVVTKRAVLFTSSLVNKIKNVTSTWFKNELEVESSKIELPPVEENKEAVPGTWDDFTKEEEIEKASLPSEVESSIEPNENVDLDSVVPTIESVPSFDAMNTVETSVEDEVEEPAVVVQAVEPVMPSFDAIPSVENEAPVDEANEKEEQEMPSFEMPSVISNNDEPVAEPKEIKEESNDLKGEAPKSIEDRISELLNRKKNEETKSKDSYVVKETIESEKEYVKPEISQSALMAKLQRFSNTLKDKDAEIKSLNDKLSKANTDSSTARNKINGYEAVVKDLTMKNNNLANENEKLSSRNTELENELVTTKDNYERQISESDQSKTEEINELKQKISDMELSHAEEIKRIKEDNEKRISDLNEVNEKKINAVYNMISEVLGDSYTEEEHKKI